MVVVALEVLGQLTRVGYASDTQRPPEGPTPHCQREACRVGMQVRSPPWQLTGRIGSEAVTSLIADRDDPQQLAGRRSLPTAHTGALRLRASYH
ncbi:hypothetical protein Pen02_15490 [Plantactinospora endophytica]|uniref:Uncharacterized protein n=1 Tax=Plantactinospora endophytica TaxID=673535 RepID=A0ABQ4DW13_9ACTN|nr:hypothetical protein Pen02_15490 [Plantactinospora endophytica]